MQIHANACKYIQIHANTCKYMQTHANTYKVTKRTHVSYIEYKECIEYMKINAKIQEKGIHSTHRMHELMPKPMKKASIAYIDTKNAWNT